MPKNEIAHELFSKFQNRKQYGALRKDEKFFIIVTSTEGFQNRKR